MQPWSVSVAIVYCKFKFCLLFLQELDFVRTSKRGRMQEAIEARHNLRKELERLRTECERKVHDANVSCGRLKRELEHEQQMHVCDKGFEPSQLRAKYSTQARLSIFFIVFFFCCFL